MAETLVKVTLPEMGESVTEGSIVEWRVKPGQWIEGGGTLVDVTTDKVDVEVPAPASGVVTAVFAAEGETIAVGAPLAEIDTTATKPADASPAPAAVPEKKTAPIAAPAPVSESALTATNGVANVPGLASHRAQRWAEREQLDLAKVPGSGPQGLILADDVRRVAVDPNAQARAKTSTGAAPTSPQPPLPADAKTTVLKGPAASLVGYMEQSLTIPTATSFRTIGVGTLDVRRAALNALLKAAGRSEKVSFTHLIAYALVQAAHELPAMVASFRREGTQALRVESGVHLGLAVDSSRKDGTRFLVVPVIKNADTLDFAGFRGAYEDLVLKARENKLAADDLTGATFTLTNPGGIGTMASVPRLMGGQGTIVAAGAIGYPPGLQKADPAALAQFGVEKVMTLTSTYDHRVIQGAQSGEFLRRSEELLAGANGFYERVFSAFGVSLGDAPVASATAPLPTQAARPAVGTAPSVREVAFSDDLLRAVASGMAIVSSFRTHGHLAADLDPLGTEPEGDPALDPRTYNLTPSVMAAVPAAVLRTSLQGDTLADILPKLRETYSSTIAYEVEHIANIEQREWLREYIEASRHHVKLSHEHARDALLRLTRVETMERFFRKTYIGQKTFSIEGLDVMIPMLEETITLLAEDGIETAVIGMAHRGRLATIAHVINHPYEELLAEFESASARRLNFDESDVTGDVKYHHGADGVYLTSTRKTIGVSLANNPSHLEAVDGVVEGRARALQTDHGAPQGGFDPRKAAPILIHGDAAFIGQGVVAEVLNLQALPGYKTGGTIHIIANNQIGFTTDPIDDRSTRHASDLAKGFDVPIIHVNADDVDACMSAVHLAIDFRRRFQHDVILDLIGYRRFGHNETDEPAYTQPTMYERIKSHPTVRELYAQKLIAQGWVTADEAAELEQTATTRLTEALNRVRDGSWKAKVRVPGANPAVWNGPGTIATGVASEKLLAWNEQLLSTPTGFAVNPKLIRQLEKRNHTFANDGEADWGLSEALAFASLLEEGTPIRMTGQDCERGTFSHRHLVLHDVTTNATHTPIAHIPGSRASFEIYNSPLSEYACVGFEYGYSCAKPDALVLWEAQFGDFHNGAQIIIDQFISAGAAKWGENSRLVLLLPHGYEGAGPEHSSARLERFLQLSGDGSMRVANCSTATQYFHLLRDQARQPRLVPLVVLTPKSLLRAKAASGRIHDMVEGRFQPVIDDAATAKRKSEITRLLLCSGKVYYDLIGHERYASVKKTAIARIELLSPLPTKEIVEMIASYPNLEEVVWVQEEPRNMGARAYVRRRLVESLPDRITDISYIGRPNRASPSEGYGGVHAVEQERIVIAALTE
ncbi:MAG TPA: multifunctional oxoglutarate decarboxylase/oxoglutarate dehydrogenase thiamine pyrophosphate-binding subunit/dihydrolipoyllysine-residue succinyltransferase subunit [Candidatus Baltobacteraceae bacterium]|nr:multifunctional oxoglutarate decarboxylase/oxoglutarate dehydrogenase thiamine pyrophosphate-binding subunit/dihydrolipoyllysine-residue succinyltransferase subunit [Candidatus Baltobacteraceae bacterium]